MRPSGAARPTALLVSPILPAAGGNGLAMRAGVFLDALAADHDVTLLLVPVAGGDDSSDFTRRRVHRLGILPLGDDTLDPLYSLGARLLDPAEHLAALRAYPRPAPCRWATSPALDAAVAAAGGARFDTVVVLRSYLAPYAAPFLAETSRRLLDLDDDERLTRRRLSELQARRGLPDRALLTAAEAAKFAVHERAWLPRFDHLLAASEMHEAAVRERHPGLAVSVVPNTVEVPETVQRAPRSPTLRLLFVGNLGYEPNVDAALWIADELMPLLRQDGSPVELRIAGSRPLPQVMALAGPGIEIRADPVDLSSHYAWADLALAPIRAGGGTRIKILEAFAERVPVVATSIGAEGLAVQDGEHLLLADDSHAFASACRRLKGDALLGTRLVANALDRVRERYSRTTGKAILQKLLSVST